MNTNEHLLTKQQAITILRTRYNEQKDAVVQIEPRLAEYFDHLTQYVSAVEGDPNDLHNLYEVLGGIKFLRLLRTYDFNYRKVRQVIRLREGEWEKDGRGMWQYVSGGLKQPGTNGAQVFRWQPFQVFVLAWVFGFQTDIDTRLLDGDRDLLPTERVLNGRIIDTRRLTTDFTAYMPRKSDKTGLSAYIQVIFFLMEDYNAEAYCCSNSSDQSKLLYRRARLMLAQLDNGHRMRMTETVCDWRPTYKTVRDSSIRPLSAGGKTKDGMFAQLCCADEYGSAGYTNGKSDMKMLVDVIQSSMGPRREPLTFTTTTAGRILTGPFIEKLEALHRSLLMELKYDTGEEMSNISSDRISALLLESDEWERDEEYLLTSHSLRRKVNPMLGIVCQHQFYDDEIAKARMSGDLDEVKTKLFNVYVSGKAVEWVRPERIRQLQQPRDITDCTLANGWEVYCGMDFSQGYDLHTAVHLAVRWTDNGPQFFADMDAWINEETLRTSSIRDLYERWIADGWLHLSPGAVFQPNLLTQRIRELDSLDISFLAFGYDAHLSKEVINELKAWLQTIGLDPEQLVIAVGQTLGAFNPAVDRLTFLLQSEDADFHFSNNPLWPWVFGNVVLDEDARMGNRKPIKRSQSDACKVDPVQCLCECILLEEIVEGRVK